MYGFPLFGALASQGNLTVGFISALAGLGDDSRVLQISAPVQPGNSGGPLLDMSGNVVGVVTAKIDALKVAELIGDIPQNVNFAIKASVVRTFLDSHGINYGTEPLGRVLSTADVADRAKKFTVLSGPNPTGTLKSTVGPTDIAHATPPVEGRADLGTPNPFDFQRRGSTSTLGSMVGRDNFV